MFYSSSSNVPIEMLPHLGLRTAKVLRSWNIRTVGQFKQLPERVLVELFGPSIRGVYYDVRGINYIKESVARKKMSQSSALPSQRSTNAMSFLQKLRLASTVLSL